MAFPEIAFAQFFGIRLTILLGIATISLLATTSVLGWLTLKGKAKFKWHKRTATLTIILAFVHAFFVVLGSI